ncbi:hypothetical protein Pint_33534 [Pistacia integerrima]|uniref:Uncharacterized protein n=1 Tax=Pistacia integerrima TaxID=434235 RepID=A0ACC0X5A5_9ROSI|nr:hypothetical protein Pint_33534 [Pistacia integerrima]
MSYSDSDSSSSYGGGEYKNFKQISRERAWVIAQVVET